MRRFCYEHKKEIALSCAMLIVTVLLCVPFTLSYAVKVFGWAVWAYWAAGVAALVTYWLKKEVNLTVKSTIFLVLSLFFALATLHIVCMPRQATATFTEYIVTSYDGGTVGGAVLGIVTSPVAVGFTYVWAIVFCMVATALFSFLFFRPFIFAGAKDPITVGKRKKKEEPPVCHEVILDESPFMRKGRSSPRDPIPVFVAPAAEKKEEDPFELLFGGEKERYEESAGHDDDAYNVRRYSPLRKAEATDAPDEEELAAEALLGPEREEEVPGEDETFPFEEEEEEEVVFEDEEDETIPDLLKPHAGKNPFLQALTMSASEKYAPMPIDYGLGEDEEEVPDEDAPGSDDEPVAPVAPAAPAPAPAPAIRPGTPEIAEDLVMVGGRLVRVIPATGAPVAPAAYPASPLVGVEEEPEEPTGYHKIVQLVERRTDQEYNRPPVSLLKVHQSPEGYSESVDNWDELKEIIEVKLANFGVEATLADAVKGPTVTMCAIKLGDKCSIAKLMNTRMDLQRLLRSKKPIAIIPQIEGTDYCGIQIPNRVKGTVSFKDILSSKQYRESNGDIMIALGKSDQGEILVEDLGAMPHALIAGETGSGKSVCLNVIIASIIFRYTPDEVKLLLIDLKEVEMAPYAGLPHMLLKEPLSDIPSIVNALKWIREEVIGRFALFKSLHIRNLSEYNRREGVQKLPRIVVIIDEASELMTDPNARKTLEQTLNSLARIARAAGIHLLFATQNPVKTVITSEIQNNLNTKIAFAVSDYVHSQVIFKAKGAECLLGRGDMYIKRGQDMRRAQCALIDTEEIEAAVNYIKENNEYSFNDEEIQKILNGAATSTPVEKASGGGAALPGQTQPAAAGAGKAALPQGQAQAAEETAGGPDINWIALKYCIEQNYVSCSFLQRKLKKGYNTVANILEELANEGYISSVPQGSKDKREILISKEDFYREWEERFGPDEDHELEHFDDMPDDPGDDEE